MFTRHTVTVLASGAREARCRFCRDRILWVTTASAKGQPARTLPFDAPAPQPLSQVRNDESGLVFEVWPRSALHTPRCRARETQRQAKRHTAQTHERHVQASRDGQGRLL